MNMTIRFTREDVRQILIDAANKSLSFEWKGSATVENYFIPSVIEVQLTEPKPTEDEDKELTL